MNSHHQQQGLISEATHLGQAYNQQNHTSHGNTMNPAHHQQQGQGYTSELTNMNPAHHQQGHTSNANTMNPAYHQQGQGYASELTNMNPAHHQHGHDSEATNMNPTHHHQGRTSEATTMNPNDDYTTHGAHGTHGAYGTHGAHDTRNTSNNYETHTKKPGLLTRLRSNHIIKDILRVLQFLSSAISLGLFSARLYKIVRTVRRASASNGAVEGILAAAVLYTLISMLMRLCLKNGGPKILRLLWIVFDLLFVGAFIAVAVLTSPGRNGSSGPCHTVRGQRLEPNGVNCNLPWGTFILAIVSTLLHALTAAFYEAKDKYQSRKAGRHAGHEEKAHKPRNSY